MEAVSSSELLEQAFAAGYEHPNYHGHWTVK